MNAMSKENELSGLSDAQLVQCYLDGNSRCFTEIVNRHHTHVHNLLHYKLHNPEWEKDAEQETFIVASLEIKNGHYHHTGHLGQYLNGIAFKQALIIIRKEHHYVHDSTALRSDEQKEEPEGEPLSLQAPEHDARTSIMREALRNLSPRHRMIICLRDIDELPFEVIAERINISEVNARVLYSRAKSHARQAMKKLSQRRVK